MMHLSRMGVLRWLECNLSLASAIPGVARFSSPLHMCSEFSTSAVFSGKTGSLKHTTKKLVS
jgi:hypothetical protein